MRGIFVDKKRILIIVTGRGIGGDAGTALNVYNAIPAEILDKAEIFVGLDKFRSIRGEITAKNLYHYTADVAEKNTIILPGTDTKLRGVAGLTGKG